MITTHPITIHQRSLPLFQAAEQYSVSTSPDVDRLLKTGAAVAIGVSGGKDSVATAIRLAEYLDTIGHQGPRILIHSDLGSVEWKDSLPACERLALRLGWELVVVKRKAGDLMARWETRWQNNLSRYADLSCVKLILPWSTPGMRFCTSELKTTIICRELKRRFPGIDILSVTGVRHAESSARAKMPTSQPQSLLARKGHTGLNWNPIIDWPTEDVYSYLAEKNEPLHEAYSRYGSTRVSCAFCIMGSIGDLTAAAECESNHEIYRTMVDLEIRSTFALQGSRWLGDVAPHVLTEQQRLALEDAKRRAALRTNAEAEIPKHLLYTAGWPITIPTINEAQLIADVRIQVAEAIGIDVAYTTAESVLQRYEELHQAKKASTSEAG